MDFLEICLMNMIFCYFPKLYIFFLRVNHVIHIHWWSLIHTSLTMYGLVFVLLHIFVYTFSSFVVFSNMQQNHFQCSFCDYFGGGKSFVCRYPKSIRFYFHGPTQSYLWKFKFEIFSQMKQHSNFINCLDKFFIFRFDFAYERKLFVCENECEEWAENLGCYEKENEVWIWEYNKRDRERRKHYLWLISGGRWYITFACG